MSHFSKHMSYSELIFALSDTVAQDRLLTRQEIDCINSSVDEPLMKEVIERYPLPSTFNKLLGQSVLAERARRPDLDCDVHSAAYGGVRDKTMFTLRKSFPPQTHIDVIARTKELVDRFMSGKNERFNTELLNAEKARLKEREREHESGRLSFVKPAASLEAIKDDFIAYTKHLELSKQEGSTYAWDILNSLFQRIDSFSEDSSDRAEAELLLLIALDNARTAYHALKKNYVEGKDYTCPKGLEERLLDAHFFLIPLESPSFSPLSNFLDRLLTPFIKYDAEMKSEGTPPTCSEILYDIYFQAAGYTKEKDVVQRYFLKLQEGRSIETLREEYLAEQNSTAEKEESQHKKNKKEEITRRFNAVIGLLTGASCQLLDEQYGDIIAFLDSHDAIEVQVVINEKVIPPAQQKNYSEINNEMLSKGNFIDFNHLYTIIAITSDHGFKKMASLAHYGKIPEPYEKSAAPTREELQDLHSNYLGSGIRVFCHFNHETTINHRLTSPHMLHTLSIAEPALCVWLNKHISALSRQHKERLAVICAKSGYSTAISMLVSTRMQQQRVSPNYIDSQDRNSLLMIASRNGHARTVNALLAAGANNLDMIDMFGYSPLILAAKDGHTSIVRELLAAGAAIDVTVELPPPHDYFQYQATSLMIAANSGDIETVKVLISAGANIDWQGSIGQDTALLLACSQGHLGVVNELIQAGANLELIDSQGNTALICATYNENPSIVKLLIDAGAKLDAQNIYGQTALSKAYKLNNTKLIEILENAHNRQKKEQPTSLREITIQAEQRFIEVASNKNHLEVDWEHLNLNRFLSCENNALEIALSYGNIALAKIILAHSSLASRVVLKALKKDFDTMLPLIIEHDRFNPIIELHKEKFTLEQQTAIHSHQQKRHAERDYNNRKRKLYKDSNEQENACPQTKRPYKGPDKN